MNIDVDDLDTGSVVEFDTMTEAWSYCQKNGGAGNYILLYHTLRKKYIVQTFAGQFPRFGTKFDFIAFFNSAIESNQG